MQRQTRVKICGITRVDQSRAISDAGADAIGIVFFEPSPRSVMDLTLAADIAAAAGPFTNVVGLFVDGDESLIANVLKSVSLDCLQFHGEESPSFCQSFDRPYMKALRMKPGLDVRDQIQEHRHARGILLDTYVKGVPGGTGERFDWQDVPHNTDVPIVLAGGLDKDNVSSAVDIAKPYAVDVSGGVENGPGDKNLELVRAFISNAKSE